MLLAARKTENRHVVLRYPLDALKIQNYRTFTPAEIVDVCAAMGVWSKQLVMDRAVILHIERTRWKQHEECYMRNMLGICIRLRRVREAWARGMFWRLCEQFCVETAVGLADVLIACMKRNDSVV